MMLADARDVVADRGQHRGDRLLTQLLWRSRCR